MTPDKEMMYMIASGQIENPVLELGVDGETEKFEGRDAKLFAFGYLTGLKAQNSPVSVEDNTST